MRKLLITLLTLSGSLLILPEADAASIKSNPSPAVSNKPLEITISGQDLGNEVYCYTWCEKIGSDSKSPFDWNSVNTPQFQMTRSGGDYTFTISDLKSFYGLTDSQLENLTSLGFIAKNKNGGQTDDLFVEVVQGRRDAYSGGEGTSSNPFILKTSKDLASLASTPSDWGRETFFRMEADIDASGLTSGIGSQSTPFAATFDGYGHTIKNLRLSSATFGAPTGLFCAVDNATIRNLGVTDAEVSGTTYTGILAGYLNHGLIERCFTTGTVSATSLSTGGLVGENANGEILNCYSGATVENSSDYCVGGLVGKNVNVITNAYSAGEVTGWDYTGGLVGANYGHIRNSFALNKKVTCRNDYAARFGGNNNVKNLSQECYSWDNIEAGHLQWTQHGDHATLSDAPTLRSENDFRNLSYWDFSTVWDWASNGNQGYPVLQGLGNQTCQLSDNYFSIESGVSDAAAGAALILAELNPTDGILRISASRDVASYAVYSVNGQTLATGHPGIGNVEIDLSAAPAAIYILDVTDGEGNRRVMKIIKN